MKKIPAPCVYFATWTFSVSFPPTFLMCALCLCLCLSPCLFLSLCHQSLAMDIRPCRTSRARRRLRERSNSSRRIGRMLAPFASYWVYPLEIAGSIRLSRRIRGRGVRLPLCIIDDCVLPFGDELTARPLLDISEEIVLYTISRAETGPKKSPTLLKRGLVV